MEPGAVIESSSSIDRPTCRLVTLGCKVNQHETQLVKEALISGGCREATRDEVANICVVNTCTVTSTGDSKGRQLIRQLARRNPGTRTIVMGCYATRDPEVLAELPGVFEVVRDKRELAAKLHASMVDSTLEVLVERTAINQPGTVRGTDRRYLPVTLPGDESDIGRLVNVHAVSSDESCVQGIMSGARLC